MSIVSNVVYFNYVALNRFVNAVTDFELFLIFKLKITLMF